MKGVAVGNGREVPSVTDGVGEAVDARVTRELFPVLGGRITGATVGRGVELAAVIAGVGLDVAPIVGSGLGAVFDDIALSSGAEADDGLEPVADDEPTLLASRGA
jgi:hypothetical protein